jgi:protein regulator of cytokinesis 1
MGEVAAELLYNMAPMALSGAGGLEAGSCAPLLAELRVCVFSFPGLEIGVTHVLCCRVLWFDRCMWKLQQLWGEIGKSREERERMVHELEAECMRVYRRKVDEATGERALLHQSLAASEAEIAALTAALGAENTTQFKVYKRARSNSNSSILFVFLLFIAGLLFHVRLTKGDFFLVDTKTTCKSIER